MPVVGVAVTPLASRVWKDSNFLSVAAMRSSETWVRAFSMVGWRLFMGRWAKRRGAHTRSRADRRFMAWRSLELF